MNDRSRSGSASAPSRGRAARRWTVDRASGWLQGVRRVVSPNTDARPSHCGLDLIVIHGISLPPGQFGGPWIDELFTNRLPSEAHPYFNVIASLRVSAHVFIARTGEPTQYVPFDRRAWHAGESVHRGRSTCNDFSIGIELEGTDDTPYESAQYRTLASVVRALRSAYPSLRDAEIVGHSDIAPGRKTDPGPCFEWERLEMLLARGR